MLINCNECGKEISDTAKQCPNCGAKVIKPKTKTQHKNFGTKKGRIAYLCSYIASCAITVCFLIVLIVAYCAPLAYLHSYPCTDGYKLLKKLTPSINDPYSVIVDKTELSISFGKQNFSATYVIYTDIDVNIYSKNDEVHLRYMFNNDGRVEIFMIYSDTQYYCNVNDTQWEFVKASRDFKTITPTKTELQLIDSCVTLAELFYDDILDENHRQYNFTDILWDYSDFKRSLKGIRISSIVLFSVFAIITIGMTTLFIIAKRKRKTSQVVEPQIKTIQGIEPLPTGTCSVCGTVNVKDAVFCDRCGNKLQVVQTCSVCGHTQKEGVNFCSECGNKFD